MTQLPVRIYNRTLKIFLPQLRRCWLPESQPQQLLVCQNHNCNEQFVDEINADLKGDAASLPAALKAHKAGWQVVDGKIFCPQCAKGFKTPIQ